MDHEAAEAVRMSDTAVMRLVLALFVAIWLFAFRLALAQVTSTRETAADWLCCDTADCTTSTQHQRQDTAIVACLNRAASDGRPRWVQGGRYRITAPVAPVAPLPPDVQPITGTVLTWAAPTLNTDGSPITGALSYIVEQQISTGWAALGSTSATSMQVTAPSGCWRVVAVAGGVQSAPTNPACKS